MERTPGSLLGMRRAAYYTTEIVPGSGKTVRVPPRWGRWQALLGLGALALLAGCAAPSSPAPADLGFAAAWLPWGDDPLKHLVLSLENAGGVSARVGPGAQEIVVAGPAGYIPLYWGGTEHAREILPQQTVVVAFHPRVDEAGRFGLAIDHAWGTPAEAPPGLYAVCVGELCHGLELV